MLRERKRQLIEDMCTRHGERFVHAEMIDRSAWEMLQRFAQAGILQFAGMPARILHRADADPALQPAETAARAA